MVGQGGDLRFSYVKVKQPYIKQSKPMYQVLQIWFG